MSKAPKLPPRIKVFRTQIGVTDWVVATSSQAAALEAWDVSRNLFATGEATQSDDPKAIAAAMSNIGKAVAMPRPKRRRK
jgi:colicin import membrane protein